MEDDNTTYEKSMQLPEVTVTPSGVSISDGLDRLREARNSFSQNRMHQFDARLYRKLIMYNEDMMSNGKSVYENMFYPHFDYGSYVTDFYETPTDIQRKLEDIEASSDPDKNNVREKLKGRKIAGVAVVSAVFGQPDIESATKELKKKVYKILN